MDILQKWQQFKKWHAKRVNDAKSLYDIEYLEIVELIMSYSAQRRKEDYKRIEALYHENQKLLVFNHKFNAQVKYLESKCETLQNELDRQMNVVIEERELLTPLLEQIINKQTVLNNYESIDSIGKESTNTGKQSQPDNPNG